MKACCQVDDNYKEMCSRRELTFKHCAAQSAASYRFFGANSKALGIMLLVLLHRDYRMLFQDLSQSVNILISFKNVLRRICLNLPLTRWNLHSYTCLSRKAPENSLLVWALYKWFIIMFFYTLCLLSIPTPWLAGF